MAKKSFLSNLIDARQRQANRYVAGYLVSLDDATLKASGYKREELAKAERISFPF